MKKLAMIGVLMAAACGGGSKKPSTTTTTPASTSVVIVDDIDCPKLVNHMVDVHAAANAEKTAANPEAVAKIRVDTIKECEARWSKTPPTEADKVAARCSMKAQTTGELEACGS